MYALVGVHAIISGNDLVTGFYCVSDMRKHKGVIRLAARLRRRNGVLPSDPVACTHYCDRMANDWWAYVLERAGGAQQSDIAEAFGVNQTTVSNWKTGKATPKPENVIQFARAFRRPPVEALIAAGYLTENEAADVVEVRPSMADIPDEALLTEVRRRMSGGNHAVEDDEEPRAPSEADQSEKTSLDHSEDWRADKAARRAAARRVGEASQEQGEVR